MREKVFIALLLATIAYLIIIISGIIMDLSLEIILSKGIVGLIIIAVISFVFISIMESTAVLEEEDELTTVVEENEVSSKEGTVVEPAADFSPLEVPVVESVGGEKNVE
ncbi:hypothetical protein GM661_02790 [Iocasia frigidifontis]|uniref:Uncharacterized protein n=1 Tax=Iocasia fonsfrigidae TaxID=2682810 RepID=A0A8A7KBN7_9FIRM|nr:hypothetical protein [Iocasia fonsfrigidae]QTL96978.1 hypothetical protein GM661_02790 [Iocasia fonsfrigidae]